MGRYSFLGSYDQYFLENSDYLFFGCSLVSQDFWILVTRGLLHFFCLIIASSFFISCWNLWGCGSRSFQHRQHDRIKALSHLEIPELLPRLSSWKTSETSHFQILPLPMLFYSLLVVSSFILVSQQRDLVFQIPLALQFSSSCHCITVEYTRAFVGVVLLAISLLLDCASTAHFWRDPFASIFSTISRSWLCFPEFAYDMSKIEAWG